VKTFFDATLIEKSCRVCLPKSSKPFTFDFRSFVHPKQWIQKYASFIWSFI